MRALLEAALDNKRSRYVPACTTHTSTTTVVAVFVCRDQPISRRHGRDFTDMFREIDLLPCKSHYICDICDFLSISMHLVLFVKFFDLLICFYTDFVICRISNCQRAIYQSKQFVKKIKFCKSMSKA